jgi:hypothetical protein
MYDKLNFTPECYLSVHLSERCGAMVLPGHLKPPQGGGKGHGEPAASHFLVSRFFSFAFRDCCLYLVQRRHLERYLPFFTFPSVNLK